MCVAGDGDDHIEVLGGDRLGPQTHGHRAADGVVVNHALRLQTVQQEQYVAKLAHGWIQSTAAEGPPFSGGGQRLADLFRRPVNSAPAARTCGVVSSAMPLCVGAGQPRYDARAPCLWHLAAGSVRLKSSRPSARAAWARSLERATPNSTVMSP